MKFLVYVLSPLIVLLLVLVRIPDFDDWLKKINPKAPLAVSVVLVVGTLFNYYLTVFSPYKLLEKMAKKKWPILAERVAMLIADYNGQYDFGFNIMIPCRGFFYQIEPSKKDPTKARFSLSGVVFKVIWKSENASMHPDLRFTINQGVCGDAYRSASATNPQNVKGAALIPSEMPKYKFNFTERQKELTADLMMVASCPLIINEKGMKDEKTKTIGVLNVECRTPGSEDLILDSGKRKELYVKIAKLSNLYVNLHV
jgi:hypothetical protein